MSPRQLVVGTLKDLTRQCLHEQFQLKMLTRNRHEIEAEERRARERIRQIKLRVNREIIANGKLIGVDINALQGDDDDGEQWKEHA